MTAPVAGSPSSTRQAAPNWSTPGCMGMVPDSTTVPGTSRFRARRASSQYCGGEELGQSAALDLDPALPVADPGGQGQGVDAVGDVGQPPRLPPDDVRRGLLAPRDAVHLEVAVGVVAGDGEQ